MIKLQMKQSLSCFRKAAMAALLDVKICAHGGPAGGDGGRSGDVILS